MDQYKHFFPDEKFKIFLEAAPDAIVVVDKDGTMVMFNQLTESMFGYSREEMVGQKIELLVPTRYIHVHIKHRDTYFAAPRTRRMGEGRELTGKRKDNSEFSIEISLSPLTIDNKNYVISIIRDITSRKKMEAKFQGLLESAPDGILVIDTSGKIVIVNSQVEKLFDYSREELIGLPIEVLVPENVKEKHVKYRDGYIKNPHTRPMGAGSLLTGRKKDGTEIPVEISLSPLETEQGLLITSIVRDITERRKAEDLISASLREKEALLKEIHHRVKNNLQVTSSLLRLQSGYIQDENAKTLFAESQNRIRSMALVHEKLYQNNDLSRINFLDYSESLALLLLRSYAANPSKIKLLFSGQPVLLSIDSAIPCGLIINEIISNSLKHAFPEGKSGEIRVNLIILESGKVQLTISDNGVGVPSDFDLEKLESLGLQLVNSLIKQINGELVFQSKEGVEFKITFFDEVAKR